MAYTELLGFSIDDGVRAMARGGLERLFIPPEKPVFDKPLSLNSSGKYRLDTAYAYDRTARIFNGSWNGSHVYAEALESTLTLPYSLWDGTLSGSLAAGYANNSVDLRAESAKEEIFFASSERYDQAKAGLFLSVKQKASLGISYIDTDFRKRPEIPLELEIAPVESFKFGYRKSYRDFHHNFDLRISGKNGSVPFAIQDDSEEVYAEGRYTDILTVRYSNELQQTDSRKLAARLKLPCETYVAGSYTKRQFDINQDIFVEGSRGGYLKGNFNFEEFRVGFGKDLARWNLETNFRRQRLNSDGGGVADSAAVVSFWPSLVVGNYNYLYHAGIDSDSYQVSGEYQGDRFSFSLGGQYIDLRPVASLDYWRSLLFGLGRTGEDNWKLTTDRIKLIFVSLGLGYRWDNVSLKYAFGQFIPIGTHDSEPKSPSTGGEAGGSSSGKPNMLTHNPGGNVQRILLSIIF